MSPQDHANHLLRVWQQRRALGFKPHERLPPTNDNQSEAEFLAAEKENEGDIIRAIETPMMPRGTKLGPYRKTRERK